MATPLYCAVIALLGLDLGYRPMLNKPGSGEFIVQVDPVTLQQMKPGDGLEVGVPAEAQTMRPAKITVVLGDVQLPHTLPLAMPTESSGTAMTGPNSDKPSFDAFAPIGGSPSKETRPEWQWLAMWIFVIGLVASNVFVGWLFLDARERHHSLLARSLRFQTSPLDA